MKLERKESWLTVKKDIIKREIQRLIMHVKSNPAMQNGEETVDLLSLFKNSNDAGDIS